MKVIERSLKYFPYNERIKIPQYQKTRQQGAETFANILPIMIWDSGDIFSNSTYRVESISSIHF